jgi:hypothetical protein
MKKAYPFLIALAALTILVWIGCAVDHQPTEPVFQADSEETRAPLAKKGVRSPHQVDPSNGRAVVVIPDKAVQVAPNIFSLGLATDNGRVVEGYAIIHYAKADAVCGNNVCEPGEKKSCPEDCGGGGSEDPPSSTESCYGLLAKGAKWKVQEDYLVDPSNVEELDAQTIRDIMAAGLQTWEDAAGQDIVLDEDASGTVDRDLIGDLNGRNEVMFADIAEENVIAVTIVWGIWGGNPNWREIVESDQVYNDNPAEFSWSLSGEADKMDLLNIVTHEHGHWLGLADLYDAACSDATMYGYGTEGETKKRDLLDGDIAGINKLY